MNESSCCSISSPSFGVVSVPDFSHSYTCVVMLLFSCQVMSYPLWPHELQHARLFCPSLSPRFCSNSCPLSWWYYLTISSCCSLLLFPSIFPSTRIFSNELAVCVRWPKYWSFSICPWNGYSGLISFRIDWFDLLVVHRTLNSFLQHHNSNTLILWHSAFFMVYLSHPNMTNRKAMLLLFICQVVSDSMWPRGLQHARLPCPLPSPRICSCSCPLHLFLPSNHVILCCYLLLLSILPSIRVFSSELALCIRWPEYWSFSFSISPSIEYSELISFKIDWFDLLAVQGTLKSLLQYHSSKPSILRPSAFSMVQLPQLYMTAGKAIALTIWTFVDKVVSLLFNTLGSCRFFIAFLLRSKYLLGCSHCLLWF